MARSRRICSVNPGACARLRSSETDQASAVGDRSFMSFAPGAPASLAARLGLSRNRNAAPHARSEVAVYPAPECADRARGATERTAQARAIGAEGLGSPFACLTACAAVALVSPQVHAVAVACG